MTLIDKNKILRGLDEAYKKMIEFKKHKKTDLIIMKDNKIVHVKPQ